MTPISPPIETQSLTGLSLIDTLLQEQQELTAVEEFARNYESNSHPRQSKYYQRLLPSRPPAPGEQYAFEVDLDRCSGCKACVTACHSLNGLDEHETWRDVGLLVGGTAALPVLQHVTAACHHCLQPACMEVCPTLAYEKDARTGIVKHLDDQCFGCQYCVLACPYDVPKYHAGKGIVRKCDMCSQRLSAGEAPACVQACPHEAIRISVVSQSDVSADCEATNFLPAAPDPQITQPTTIYKTRQVFPRNMIPADYYAARIEEAHPPLIVMLVLTQLSVGAYFVNAWLANRHATSAFDGVRGWQSLIALGFGMLALGSSTLHLGRPHLAWRAFLGLRKSWLSREIVAFGAFAAAAAGYSAGEFLGGETLITDSSWRLIRASVLASGLAGVLCSVMIYYRTRRPTWGGTRTLFRFIGTSIWLGLAAMLFASMIAAVMHPDLTIPVVMQDLFGRLYRPLVVAALAKLTYEASDLLHLLDRHQTPLKRMAQLMTRELAGMTTVRFAIGALGGVILPSLLMNDAEQTSAVKWFATVTAIFAMSVCGELLERTLFFMTAVAPRMPGAVRA